QTIRALAVRGDETLRRHRLTTPERFQKVEIAVWTPPVNDAIGLAFEHNLKTHLASSLSSVNVGVDAVKSLDLSRRVRGEAGHFYPTLVGLGGSLLWSGRETPGGGIAAVGQATVSAPTGSVNCMTDTYGTFAAAQSRR